RMARDEGRRTNAAGAWASGPNTQHPTPLLRFPVHAVDPALRAVLPQLQPRRRVLLVLRGGVVALFALRARHPDDDPVVLSHVSYPFAAGKPPMGIEPMTPFLPRRCSTSELGRRYE